MSKSKNKNLAEFLALYDPDGTRILADITPACSIARRSSFVIVRHGPFTAVLVLMPFEDHLCIAVHPFADGEDTTAGVFGMTEGRQHTLPDTGTTSHGWPSAHLVSVLIGEQAGQLNAESGHGLPSVR
jgi:hypothetical protein